MINRWSYSRLGTYESCPKKAYYRYIEKIPEEQHPAAERGIKIHGLAEQYIKGELEEMPKELYLFYSTKVSLCIQTDPICLRPLCIYQAFRIL